MTGIYHTENIPFRKKNRIRILFDYCYKTLGDKDVTFKQTPLFQLTHVSKDCTVEVFFTMIIDNLLINGFCKLQSVGVKWEKMKVEHQLTGQTSVLQKQMKSVYGTLEIPCDTSKGFLFVLIPAKGSNNKKYYLRGVPDILNFFDKGAENEEMKRNVIHVEKLFLREIGNDSCKLHYMCQSTKNINGVEAVTSAEAVRLHIFKKKDKEKKKQVTLNNKY